jgi:hypothetical protein
MAWERTAPCGPSSLRRTRPIGPAERAKNARTAHLNRGVRLAGRGLGVAGRGAPWLAAAWRRIVSPATSQASASKTNTRRARRRPAPRLRRGGAQAWRLRRSRHLAIPSRRRAAPHPSEIAPCGSRSASGTRARRSLAQRCCRLPVGAAGARSRRVGSVSSGWISSTPISAAGRPTRESALAGVQDAWSRIALLLAREAVA